MRDDDGASEAGRARQLAGGGWRRQSIPPRPDHRRGASHGYLAYPALDSARVILLRSVYPRCLFFSSFRFVRFNCDVFSCCSLLARRAMAMTRGASNPAWARPVLCACNEAECCASLFCLALRFEFRPPRACSPWSLGSRSGSGDRNGDRSEGWRLRGRQPGRCGRGR